MAAAETLPAKERRLAPGSFTPFQAASLILSLPLFLPLAAIVFLAVTADGSGWPDLLSTVLEHFGSRGER